MLPCPTNASTLPLGASLRDGGVVFRLWAPEARAVYLLSEFRQQRVVEDMRLTPLGDGTWAGFLAGASAGHRYRFHVVGLGSTGPKRDPRARALSFQPAFPNCDCLVRSPVDFPWRVTDFRPPPFNELVVYQLHVGTFHSPSGEGGGTFLDVATQLPYFSALGVNALQLMPIVEFATPVSMGYNGTDYFSPENDYAVDDPARLQDYHGKLTELFARRGLAGYPSVASITAPDDQLRALVDLAHAWGIAVLLDVVYNHAGGFYGDDFSLYFIDRQVASDPNNSQYFTDKGWAGGTVFAYWKTPVVDFLRDHALACLEEFHCDGFRFDEVSVMDRFGGWGAAQVLTQAIRSRRPEAISIAEYWPVNGACTRPVAVGGAGFDGSWSDVLREAVRGLVARAAGGASVALDLDSFANALGAAPFADYWRAVQCVENHDIVKKGEGPRIPTLADPGDPFSWWARSRSRLATGLLLCLPGIPQLFMGQEIMESRSWSDFPPDRLLPDFSRLRDPAFPHARDFLRCVSDLIALRRDSPALSGERLRVYHVHNDNRVLAFHRWVEGQGYDRVVVLSLREQTWWGYELGFPGQGVWRELFNSDLYDHYPNPAVAGNGGQVEALGPGRDAMPTSASLVIPANSLLVFGR